MEDNEISMFMDVKLDIHERKSEASKFKSWTKCLVKIESIKCFPCYIRITLIKDIQDECSNFYIRINIPGITIRAATSRTKQFSYGIFWKQNRKRCCIFFALDSSVSYENHMKWMKRSVKNLELHRQEFIETRRNSRYNGKTLPSNQVEKNNESIKASLQDILGPLPKIPDISENSNWSRRVSGLSEIYEEIPDIEQYGKRNSRRVSRASIASGIYEEMKPVPNSNFEAICENEKSSEEGPPLPPPRKRVNTLEIITDTTLCNVNPEVEIAKKKKYITVLETVFGRSKRCNSVSESKVSTKDDLISITPDPKKNNTGSSGSSTPKTRKKLMDKFHCINSNTSNNSKDKKTTACNKRNSFSSPDLTNINYVDEFEDFICIDSLSSDYSDLSTSIPDLMKEEEEKRRHIVNEEKQEPKINKNNNEVVLEENNLPGNNVSSVAAVLNVSEQMSANFNFSCNSSSINLVGANLNDEEINITATATLTPSKLIDDLSGYCIMAPIIKNDQQRKENQKNCITIDTDTDDDDNKENNEKLATNVGNPVKYSIDSVVYENMNPITESSLLQNEKEENNSEKSIQNDENKQQQHNIYQNLINLDESVNENDTDGIYVSPKNDNENIENNIKNDKLKTPKTTARKSINFDEKIPSYYPNNYCDIGRCFRYSTSSNNNENFNSKYEKNNTIKNSNTKITTINNDNNDDLMKLTTNHQRKENSYVPSPIKSTEHNRKLNLQRNHHNNEDQLTPSSKSSSSSSSNTSPSNKSINNISPIPLRACKITKNMYKVTKLPENSLIITDAIQNLKSSNNHSRKELSTSQTNIIINNSHNNIHNHQNHDCHLNKISYNKKYATLARLSPHKYLEKSSILKKAISYTTTNMTSSPTTNNTDSDNTTTSNNSTPNELGSLKKFASLPRLKKIDFLPLKLKKATK